MKTRIQKYYIESQSGSNRSLICANKLKNAKDHLPTDEQITNHMLYEKLACKNDKERRPKPLLIMVENRIFNALVDELVNEKNGTGFGMHLVYLLHCSHQIFRLR